MEVPERACEAIDAYIAGEMSRRRIPGLSLAVAAEDDVIAAAYGDASLELAAPATTHTVYEIGSLTKQFTAAAVLLLAGDAALRLDDPVGAHADGLPSAWAPIPLRHLLAHTSGIPEYLNAEDIVRFSREEHAPAEVIALIGRPAARFHSGDGPSATPTPATIFSVSPSKPPPVWTTSPSCPGASSTRSV
jgi:CubicO group peptidase (beta-lactamase class C family)